jgi:hypothetical protein
MAHSHFVMDLFYQEGNDPDRFRREVLRIEAKDDAEAETEGRRVNAWRKPAYFIIRAIATSARNREREIFDSRSEHEAPVEEPATVVPAEVPVDGEAPAPKQAALE